VNSNIRPKLSSGHIHLSSGHIRLSSGHTHLSSIFLEMNHSHVRIFSRTAMGWGRGHTRINTTCRTAIGRRRWHTRISATSVRRSELMLTPWEVGVEAY
jgi:hypothetical protein